MKYVHRSSMFEEFKYCLLIVQMVGIKDMIRKKIVKSSFRGKWSTTLYCNFLKTQYRDQHEPHHMFPWNRLVLNKLVTPMGFQLHNIPYVIDTAIKNSSGI